MVRQESDLALIGLGRSIEACFSNESAAASVGCRLFADPIGYTVDYAAHTGYTVLLIGSHDEFVYLRGSHSALSGLSVGVGQLDRQDAS